MYTRSAAFDAAVQKSHRIATRCDVYSGTTFIQSLDIIDGNITIDDVPVRRRATVDLTDPTGALTPADASALLAPSGNELKLWRGLYLPDGTSELLPMGVFGISDVRIDDSGQGLHIRLDTYDRARKVQRARFLQEYQVTAGTNYGTAIQTLLTSRFPTITFNFTATSILTPRLIFEAGSDPWKAAQSMAASIGCDLFFDPNGVCVLRPISLVGDPAWTYAEGSQAMILYVNRRLNDEKVFNHVVVTGETSGTATPVRAEAFDNNPSSPTYYLGAYGDVVTFEASSFITTTAQAQAAANRKLAKVLGLSELIQFNTIVHPAHEISDIVRLTRADSKVNNVYVIGKLTMPMVHSRVMNGTCRQRVLTA